MFELENYIQNQVLRQMHLKFTFELFSFPKLFTQPSTSWVLIYLEIKTEVFFRKVNKRTI